MSWASDKAREFANRPRKPVPDEQAAAERLIRETIEQSIHEVYDPQPFTRAKCAIKLRALLKDEATVSTGSTGATASTKE